MGKNCQLKRKKKQQRETEKQKGRKKEKNIAKELKTNLKKEPLLLTNTRESREFCLSHLNTPLCN